MDSIFHEKQQGSLCAQHALNALLQGPYFTPVDLATLGHKMDEEERERMAELGIDTEEYRRFIQQPSGNMDDSGYFSVQVLSAALAVWNLELVPFNSSEPLALTAKSHPEDMRGFICNFRDHWLTIRKIGHQWFNLNSLLSGPELLSTTYLSIFLAQLQQDGMGELPVCRADEVLLITPAVQDKKPKLKTQGNKNEASLDEEDDEIKAAIQRSLEEEGVDPSLVRAIEMSLGSQPKPQSSNNQGNQEVDVEEIRRKRLAYLDAKSSQS